MTPEELSVIESANKFGFELIDVTPRIDNKELHISLLNDIVLEDVDGIIMYRRAGDEFYMKDFYDRFFELNIPVVSMTLGDNHSAVKSIATTDNYLSGLVVGKYILENMNKEKVVLIVCGENGSVSGDQRRNSVVEVLEENGVNVIVRHANWDVELAYRYATEELESGVDIGAIYGCWDPAIDIISEVVEEKGILGDILLVGFDGLPNTLNLIREGKVDATLVQIEDDIIDNTLKILLTVIEGKTVDEKYAFVGSMATQENIDDYL